MNTISFEDLGLDEAALAAVAAKGFEFPSPIQVLAIPRLLDGDANVIAKARTGTGKTAAFGIPLIQKIRQDAGHPQALILTPTRELALQVCKEIESLSTGTYPRLAAVYGGQSMGEQLRALKRGVEIVVGTPGRVQDHLQRGSLKLDNISYFVLDEADEMLDMGFIDDIEAIFSKANPASRVLLFSATMPPAILKIASKFMGEYEIVEEEERPEEPILTEQRYWIVREGDKIEALVRLIDISPDFYGLVFTQTKVDADTVSKQLDERGYEAAALHGDIPQNQREKILSRFRSKKTRILVATDVAARGIDIEGLTHVVNYAMPFDGPTYIHRIGRTGRAGSKGLAFTLVRPEERRKLDYLRAATQKATKGTLKEEKIPSVEEVLAVKRVRLFDEIKQSLGFASAACGEDDTMDETAECINDETGRTDSAALSAPNALKVDESFITIAHELCESRDAKEVLAAVLSLSYGRALDPSHYGDVAVYKTGPKGSSTNGADGDQVRLYVSLGKRDGFNPREIAEYFSGLLNIPQRLVDRIEVTENFSLVSLPAQAARDVLERSKRDRTLPSMHVDSKDTGGMTGRGRRGGFEGSRDSAPRGKRSSYGSREGGGQRNGGERSGSGRSAPPRSGRPAIHQNRTSNAGLYRKSAGQNGGELY